MSVWGWQRLLAVLEAGLFLAGCQQVQPEKTTKQVAPVTRSVPIRAPKNKAFEAQYTALLRFLKKEMVQKDGVYTNYRNDQQTGTKASGHAYLSESSGLWLQHLALTRQNAAFSAFYHRTKRLFWQGHQFSYRYQPTTRTLYPVNAPVDDFRIMRSLLQMPQSKWQQTARGLYAKFQVTNLRANQLTDYVDASTGKRAKTLTLCYVDLATLKQLGSKAVYQKALLQVQNGHLSSAALPLFATRLNLTDQSYTKSATINIVESLLTALHLSEVQALSDATWQWVRQQVRAGQLMNRYTATGQAASEDQSAAAYALAALLAMQQHDQATAKNALQHALAFQMQTDSPLNGGLGDAASQTVYSFDNLMTLVALDTYCEGQVTS